MRWACIYFGDLQSFGICTLIVLEQSSLFQKRKHLAFSFCIMLATKFAMSTLVFPRMTHKTHLATGGWLLPRPAGCLAPPWVSSLKHSLTPAQATANLWVCAIAGAGAPFIDAQA